MGIWNEKYECLSRDEMQQVQLERLQATVNRAYENVAFYKRLFDQMGIAPEEIRSLDDLSRFPFTTREDLRDGYPYDMFAVSLRDVVRIHSSSGMKYAPTVCGYTKKDLVNWMELAARTLSAVGIDKDDVVQVYFGHGLFAEGFGFQHGAESIGASVIPVSEDGPERQVAVMRDYKISALVGTPTYALSIAEQMEETKVDPHSLSLRVGVFGGAPWSEAVRAEIEKRLKITATDYYSLSELGGPISAECENKCGLHVFEDHFLAEIVDPKTGKLLEPGSVGELVLTTLTREALPLIRYRTRNLTSIDYTRCSCGRTLARMSRVCGRTDDMIVVQGVSFYPSQIEAILAEMECAELYYRLIIDREGSEDILEIEVAVSGEVLGDTVGAIERLEGRICTQVRAELGISPLVRLAELRTLKSATGGSKGIVVDKRT